MLPQSADEHAAFSIGRREKSARGTLNPINAIKN
jgi:hypothetical protein